MHNEGVYATKFQNEVFVLRDFRCSFCCCCCFFPLPHFFVIVDRKRKQQPPPELGEGGGGEEGASILPRKKRPYKRRPKTRYKKSLEDQSHDLSDGEEPIAQQLGENSSALGESHDHLAAEAGTDEWLPEEEEDGEDVGMKPRKPLHHSLNMRLL